MNTKKVFFGGVVVVVVVSTVLFFGGGRERSSSPSDLIGLMVGANAIDVAEQAPSRTLSVATVRFEKPGFVVVHENPNGGAGGILGVSDILPAGETNNLTSIPLSRLTLDGETLYVMLYFDDGDGAFDISRDNPVLDPVDARPMMMIVTLDAEATDPDAVSL